MKEIHQETGQALKAQQDALAKAITAQIYARKPELLTRYGEGGRAKCSRDVKYHLAYLSEAIATANPSLFTDYVAWVSAFLSRIGGLGADFASDLAHIRDVLQRKLPKEMGNLASEYVRAGLKQLSQPHIPPPILVGSDLPLAGLAKEYLDALLRGERYVANRLILEAVDRGVDIRDVYLHVFQRTQHEIVRLRGADQLSVAQGHDCSVATQRIMSQLCPRVYTAEKIGRRLVATCVNGAPYEVDARIVADFFEMEGWDTYYLGANTPAERVVGAIEERQADVLTVSATLHLHVDAVKALIECVRSSDASKGVKILASDASFNRTPDLCRQAGADGCVRDAQEAIRLANALLDAKPG